MKGNKSGSSYFRFIVTLGLLLLIFTASKSEGQSGSIKGIVTDRDSEKALSSVKVSVEGINLSAVTDKFGRYRLTHVPAGSHTLQFEAPGFVPRDIPVSVESGAKLNKSVELEFELNGGDRFFFRNSKIKSSQILAGTINSPGMGHAISAAEMEKSGDISVQRGLIRMPGVQAGRHGEINIRGVGRNLHEVSVDGQRMASTVPGGRSVDLNTISADLTHNVEIIKVLTPEMDAEGVSGVVRLNTWQPVGEREIHVRAGGLANPQYTRYTGLGNMGSIQYSEKYNDALSLAVDLSYQQDNWGYESIGINYDAANIGSEWLDVIEQISPALNSEKRNRVGGKLQMSYQPDEQSSYYIQGLLNSGKGQQERHSHVSTANNDWLDQTTTGSQGEEGLFAYNPMLQRVNNNNYMVQAGGRHLLKLLTIDYKAGWSHSYSTLNNFDFLFSTNDLDYQVNMEDRTRPEMVITNIRLMEDGTVDQRSMDFTSTERIRDEQEEDRYSVRLDFEVPVGPALLEFGSNGVFTEVGRSYEEADLSTLRTYNLLRFSKVSRSNYDIFDQYFLPYVIETGDAARYVDTSRPDMRLDEDDMIKRSEPGIFLASENIYGGYGMATLKLNRFRFMGGVRVEQTDATYNGQNVKLNHFDTFDSATDTSRSVSYLNLFPNARLMYSPGNDSSLKLALSRAMKRPDYHVVAPFELLNAADTTRFSGNPDLKPIISDNLDLMYEHYLSGIGAISIGLYYKEFSNSVVLQEQAVTSAEFPFLTVPDGETVEITELRYINDQQKASIYGLEVSWQQHLQFLPGFLGNFGLNANYTWSESAKDNSRNVALRFQSPHIVNAAIDYNHGRFSSEVAWHWSAASLYQGAPEVQWAPSLNPTEQIYLDLYEDGWRDLSASFGFRLSERFRFWAHASNLMPMERIRYGNTKNIYPFETDLQSGLRITTGFRFTL